MVKLGFHVSIAGSFDLAVERAKALSCDTFQMFTRSPRVWAAKPISDGAAISFKRTLEASGIGPVVDHMPYLPNPAAEKPDIYEKSVATLTEELNRCHQLGIPYLVTHLGHHGKEDGHKTHYKKIPFSLLNINLFAEVHKYSFFFSQKIFIWLCGILVVTCGI